MRKRKLTLSVLLGLTGIAALAIYGFTGRAMMSAGPAGSYFVKVEKSDDPNTTMQMLATFTDGGQILTTDTVAFGATPFRCPSETLANDNNPNKFQSPGHGVWERRGRSIFLQVVTFRFDQNGNPSGMLQVSGLGKPGPDGTASGKAKISFFSGTPPGTTASSGFLCSVDATFTAIPLKAETSKGEENENQ